MVGLNTITGLLTGGAEGARRGAMEDAGFNEQQIAAVEKLVHDHPVVEKLDLKAVITDDKNPDMQALKNKVLEVLGDPRLADKFGKTLQDDPTLVDRMNALIHDDPKKLCHMVDEFKEKPDNLADLLKENVTDQQVAAEAARAQQQQDNGNFLQQMQSQFGNMLGQIPWETIGAALLAIIHGINGLTDSLMGGFQKLMTSDELVADGNGGANGPFAQIAQVFGMDTPTHQQGPNGDITTGPANRGTAPNTEPASGTTPQPDADPSRAPSRNMAPGS